MRIFIAGATGAIGRRLVPLLVSAGHDVVGSTRNPDRAEALRAAGAQPALMDPLDPDAVLDAVTRAKPDVVVHELTSLSKIGNFKKMDDEFAVTNRLRTEGTDNLLAAARAAGARRFVAQSFTGWPYAREGGPVKDEEDPLDPHTATNARNSLAAIRRLESAVTGAADLEGVVTRFGGFYGPGTSLGTGGEHLKMVKRRQFPIVGRGGGVWSFCHIDDAATATVAAIERAKPGLYNIVDDEPAPVAVWLPYLAEVVGAPRPRRLPAWMVRPLVGEVGIVMMTSIRGASNAKAKRELGWQPRFASWREGFRHGLG